jgi:hypothetical protein
MVAIAGITPDGYRWKLAPCLVVLVRELKERYPDRSTRSDGSIASAAHSKQNPTSDHEVDRKDGFVKALDLTDDPPRFDPDDFADLLIRRRDQRIKYVIKDGRIWRSYPKPALPAWVPQPYTGSNSHSSHAHISVTDAAARDTGTWFGAAVPTTPPPPVKPPEDYMADARGAARLTMRQYLGRGPKDEAELRFHAAEMARLGLDGYIVWLEVQPEAQAWARKLGAEVRTPDPA